MNDQDHRRGSIATRMHAVPHEELVEAALEDAAPSRAAIWAWFAAGAIAIEKDDARSAAGIADALLAEYDQRFP